MVFNIRSIRKLFGISQWMCQISLPSCRLTVFPPAPAAGTLMSCRRRGNSLKRKALGPLDAVPATTAANQAVVPVVDPVVVSADESVPFSVVEKLLTEFAIVRSKLDRLDESVEGMRGEQKKHHAEISSVQVGQIKKSFCVGQDGYAPPLRGLYTYARHNGG